MTKEPGKNFTLGNDGMVNCEPDALVFGAKGNVASLAFGLIGSLLSSYKEAFRLGYGEIVSVTYSGFHNNTVTMMMAGDRGVAMTFRNKNDRDNFRQVLAQKGVVVPPVE
ncbi:MAG: hypothetical protein IKG91_00260, partial [Firmicutes bacterium]|nr:hypothetical protein [Bacillota bacterium]